MLFGAAEQRAFVVLGEHEPVRDAPRRYLNRLSDLMFVSARVLNRHRADGGGGMMDVGDLNFEVQHHWLRINES